MRKASKHRKTSARKPSPKPAAPVPLDEPVRSRVKQVKENEPVAVVTPTKVDDFIEEKNGQKVRKFSVR